MSYDKLGYTIKATELRKWIDNTATSSEQTAWRLALSDIYGKSAITSLADSSGNIDIGEFVGTARFAGGSAYPYTSFLTDLHRQANGTSLYSFLSRLRYTTDVNGENFYVKTLGNTALKLAFPYHLINNEKLFGISKGGEFEGKLLEILGSPETDGVSTNNLLDYTKYKITRKPDGVYIYRYRVTRTSTSSGGMAALPYWQYTSNYYADYSSDKHPFKLVDGVWGSGGSLVSSYSKDYFSNGVVPMQFVLLVSGAGGSGGYKTVWDSASAGGGGGAFAVVYLDWSKVPVDDKQNRSVWIRIPHRSWSITSNSSYQNYYNLSTALSSIGELCVDPRIRQSTDPILYDCYNNTNCIQINSGVNAGYNNKTGKNAFILNAGSENPIAESTIGEGINEEAFTIIAHAYGGEGASTGAANAKSAHSLLYGVQDTICTNVFLQTRIANSASARSLWLTNAYAATTGVGAGGSSWFSSGSSANSNAPLTAYGAGGGGRSSGADPGFLGGPGCVKIYY